ncbi:MAG: hypothetical protein LBS36_13160 [Oscillospiraceae bacterium]|jgi:dipicolinate synthase subunit A|nr:hypothetical protein [Oscillospiraceae bacterium]
MKHKKTLLIIGGDKRQVYMPEYLISKGFDVILFGFDNQVNEYAFHGTLETALSRADGVILPLPGSRDGTNINAPFSQNSITFADLLACVDNTKTVFGGMLPKEWVSALKTKGVVCHDYFASEELALLNAVPTAEGVVGTIIFNLPITVKDAKVAITGFGRCGAATAKALGALGAEITIVVRGSVAVAKAQIEGYHTCYLKDFAAAAGSFDAIVNTVPSLIIDRSILESMNPETPVIEIASAPFGVDFEAAQELKIKVIKEGSIPGRTAPKTAGKIISETICHILEE